MNNYLRVASWDMIGDYHNCVGNIYYVVFKPKNKNYDPKKDLMDHCRKKLGKCSRIIIAREINATKVHYHALVMTDRNLINLMHEKQDSRFFYNVQEVPNTQKDIMACHNYVIKESRKRYFYNNKDIYAFFKKRRVNNNSVPYDFNHFIKKELSVK